MLNSLTKKMKVLQQRGLSAIEQAYWSNKIKNKQKIFCIGRNKTGTTSLQKAFEDLGYRVGNQRQAEIIYDRHVRDGNFNPLFNYCKSAQVFQDVPFSHIRTLKPIDEAFPDSKFILSIRTDAQAWYESMVRFHIKLFGIDGRLPTADELKQVRYVRKGYVYENIKFHYNTPDNDLYNPEIMMAYYNTHNNTVLTHFENRPNDLLVIDLSDPKAYSKMLNFLSIQSPYTEFPWENKTNSY